MNERTTVIVGTLGTIILCVFASIIAWFAGGNKLQGAAREIIRKMFNVELNLFVVAVVAGFIPVVGKLLALVIFVINLFVAIMAFQAYNKETEFSVPCYEIIK